MYLSDEANSLKRCCFHTSYGSHLPAHALLSSVPRGPSWPSHISIHLAILRALPFIRFSFGFPATNRSFGVFDAFFPIPLLFLALALMPDGYELESRWVFSLALHSHVQFTYVVCQFSLLFFSVSLPCLALTISWSTILLALNHYIYVT